MRTRSLFISSFAICVLGSASLWAQQRPTPPSELARYERLLGNWQGSGQATMEPGGESSPWTSTASVTKAMNGFFLQEDVVIDLGEGAPSPIVFRSFYGFDRETQRYMSCSMGNMGAPSASEIHWADADTMVTVETSVEEGQVVVDRWVTKLGKDSISFVGYRTVGAGEPFVHVEGRATRAEKGVEPRAIAAAHSFEPIGPEMAKLNRIAGTYRLRGTYQAMPETEPMQIAAKEVFEPLFGGSILEVTVLGDDTPGFGVYEAWGAFGWNPAKRTYTSIYVNNMGEISHSEARWVGDRFVSTWSGPSRGQPMAMRSVIELDAKGALTRGYVHSLVGVHDVMKAFEARYERQ